MKLDWYKKIVLVGFMGSGKSLIGSALAQKLNIPFLDLDHAIEEKEGKSVQTIFAEFGEPYFRALETKYLTECLALPYQIILSTGGGTPCFSNNIQLIQQASQSIFLNVSPEMLFKRLILEKEKRPLIRDLQDDKLLEFIENKLHERLPYYQKSTIELEIADEEDVEKILRRILDF